jgi:hypothetical protein
MLITEVAKHKSCAPSIYFINFTPLSRTSAKRFELIFKYECYIYIYNLFFSAFNLKDASCPDKWDGCVCLFEHNLPYQSWSSEVAALRSFSRFIIQ